MVARGSRAGFTDLDVSGYAELGGPEQDTGGTLEGVTSACPGLLRLRLAGNRAASWQHTLPAAMKHDG